MQNFTLGKKGISMLFFTLFLLIGNLTVYSQTVNCPTISDDTQDFCYLKRVSDLEASSGGDGIRWYRTPTSSTPIPSNELLQNNTTYYAGNNSGNCTTRPSVFVTVDNYGAPSAQFGNTYEPCEYSSDDTSTVQTLINNVSGNDVEIFAEEFGEDALDPSTVLIEGNSYFAGQRNPSTGCRTSRIALRYDPVLAEAPTAQSTQTFCKGATVADLSASGTSPLFQAIRWYSTSTSNPQLPSNTELVNGETYFASQIVNRNNSNLPPCESQDRFEVTVVVNEANAGEDNTNNELCLTEVQTMFNDPNTVQDDVKNYFLSLLESGVQADGTFTPSISDLINQYSNNPIDTFETEYEVTSPEGCTDTAILSLTVVEDPDAGADNTNNKLCLSEAENMFQSEDDVRAYYLSLLESGVDKTGTFDPTIEELIVQYQNDPTDTFFTTYSLENGANCSDSANLAVEIIENPNAGNDNSNNELCRSEAESEFNSYAGFENYFYGLLDPSVDQGGDFDPTLSDLYNDYQNNPISSFQTTYILTNQPSGCKDTANLAVNITENETANAGNIENLAVCSDSDDIILEELLDSNAVKGGSFSGYPSGIFSPSNEGEGTYDIIYTIDNNSNPCVTGTDSESFKITVNKSSFAGADNVNTVICQDEAATTFTSVAAAREFFLNLLEQDVPENGSFNPNLNLIATQYSLNPIGTFSTTYTVGSGECSDSTKLAITIAKNEQANAGTIDDITICTSSQEINLFDLLDDDATKSGNFDGYPKGTFNPSQEGPGTYLITYNISNSSPCVTGSDSTSFTVEVSNTNANAGSDKSVELCSSQVGKLINENQVRNYYLSLLDKDVSKDGTFDPSIQSLIDRYNTSGPAGAYKSTYTVKNGSCSDSADITVNVIESTTPNAGADVSLVFCSSDIEQNLYDFIDNGDTNGIFEGFPNGQFIPSENLGDNAITYTVSSNSKCSTGTDKAIFTIKVNEAPAAPVADANQDLCLVDSPTVEDIVVTGDNIVWYEDEALTTTASGSLENDEDYYAVSVSDSGCTSDAIKVIVTLNDSVAPTLSFEGNEFCRQDNPTVQALINNLNGDGIQIYQSADAGSALTSSTLLQNGATYYATATDPSFGCESTERLAIVVKVGFCGIPEGFSPNGDNVNDRFVIPDIAEDYPNYSIEIYNRWGNLVFNGNASTPDWDGISNQSSLGDEVLPVGFYFYILNYNDGQTEPVQGKVYISR
jgi:large repetitive protein